MSSRTRERSPLCKPVLSPCYLFRSEVIMGDNTRPSVEHSLALKVMRLTRPSLGSSPIVQSSGTDLEK